MTGPARAREPDGSCVRELTGCVSAALAELASGFLHGLGRSLCGLRRRGLGGLRVGLRRLGLRNRALGGRTTTDLVDNLVTTRAELVNDSAGLAGDVGRVGLHCRRQGLVL